MEDRDGSDGTPGGPVPGRGRAVIAGELAELRRHLVDVPPHHAAGTRRALEERIRRLERELARLARTGGTR